MAPNIKTLMLSIQAKKTDTVDVKAFMMSYVKNKWSNTVADEASTSLIMVNQLRRECTGMVAQTKGAQEVIFK